MKTAMPNNSMLALIEQVGIHFVNPPLLKIQSSQKTQCCIHFIWSMNRSQHSKAKGIKARSLPSLPY